MQSEQRGGFVHMLHREQLEGEDLFDTAHRVLIFTTLQRTGGRQDIAADELGVSQRKLSYQINRLGLRDVARMLRRRSTVARTG